MLPSSSFSSVLRLSHDVTSSSGVERTSDVKLSTEQSFSDLHLSAAILAGLEKSGFSRPSPVQWESIPPARLGLDLIVQAKAGTGKTLVYVVTAMHAVDTAAKDEGGGGGKIQVVVLAPTREIAVQGARAMIDVSRPAMPELRVASFIGGISVAEDEAKLKAKNKCPHVAIGTPGRIRQLVTEGKMQLGSVKLFVLDEADKLMDDSFLDDVTAIFNAMPANKQLLALSATYPERLAKTLERYMRDPTHLRLNPDDRVLRGATQYAVVVKRHPLPQKQNAIKTRALLELLDSVSFSQCLVFSNYAVRAEAMCEKAVMAGWPAEFIAASQDQFSRLYSINSLKQFRCRVLFSTDLTARGIDACNVNLVINSDVAWDADTHLHRMGRAGRYGTRGISVTIAAEGDEYERLRKVAWRTGSNIWIIKAPPGGDKAANGGEEEEEEEKKIDLWNCEEGELPMVEPLECAAEEDIKEEREATKKGGGKVRKRGGKKKQSEQESNTKSQTEAADLNSIKWEAVETTAAADSPAAAKTPATIEAVNIDDLENGASSRNAYLAAISKFICATSMAAATAKLPTEASVASAVNGFVESDKIASLAAAKKAVVPKAALTALGNLLGENEYLLDSGLADVRQRLKDLSLQECLDVAKGERTVPPQVTAISVAEEEDDGGVFGSDVGEEADFSCLSADLLEMLPHRNPNRIVSGGSGLDALAFQRWMSEVAENAEFIRFMEFKRKMEELEQQQ